MANQFISFLVLSIKFVIDNVGALLSLLNIHLIPLNYEQAIKGMNKVHYEHIKKDKFFMKNLKLMMNGLSNASDITLTGRFIYYNQLYDVIKSRYNFDNYVKENPKVRNVDIKNPVFIVTLPRTGSTFMHVTMQQDKRWYCPEVWLQNVLVPPPSNPLSESDNKVIKEVDWRLGIAKYLWGKRIESAHPLFARSPEDILMNLMCVGAQFYMAMVINNLDDYMDYLMNLDKSTWVEMYRSIKLMMQCYMYNYPTERLLTMSHSPYTNVAALLEVFPDAKIVTIHRDPAKSLASITSLLGMSSSQFFSIFGRDLKVMGDNVSDMCLKGTNLLLEQREELEEKDKTENRFIDVYFKDIVRNPMETFKDLYEKLEMPWTDEWERTCKTYITSQREHKKGTHSYKDNLIRKEYYHKQFSDYIKKFSIELNL
ncbi:unnamed protein product [Dimorphilus gyrociliatus]|uniref:Uncharacterized protein n=1 Tax=Dimorphilus gyrociliatus TaxID=2664684 RepID=A0A7I8V8A0_9ANNE|nr:unnamed protein product [Dimorphilus gyrociliatus]